MARSAPSIAEATDLVVVPPSVAGEPAVATSVRIPRALRVAGRAAVSAGLAESLTELIVDGLRGRLRELASADQRETALRDVRRALEEHYAEHPDARPSLALVSQSAAQLDGHPAADRRDLIDAAVEDLGQDAFVEDVLSWVQGALATERLGAGTATTR